LKDVKSSKGFRPDFKALFSSGLKDFSDFKSGFMNRRPDFRNFMSYFKVFMPDFRNFTSDFQGFKKFTLDLRYFRSGFMDYRILGCTWISERTHISGISCQIFEISGRLFTRFQNGMSLRYSGIVLA